LLVIFCVLLKTKYFVWNILMAITATQSVLTLDYWKYARHIEVGDWVFDKDGKPVQVTLVQQYHAEECYEVMFDDYLTISGDARLSFRAENEKYRKRLHEYKMVKKNGFKRPLKFLSVTEIQEIGLLGRNDRKEFSIPTTKPIQFPAQTPGIPPFIFGYWFFNRKSHKTFTANAEAKDFIYQKFKDAGYKTTELNAIRGGLQRFYEEPNIEWQLAPNIPTKIPTNYLMASPEERVELLSGLINGKPRQYDKKTDWFRVTTGDFPTIQQIQGLVESLGCRTRVKQDAHYGYYTLSFRTKHTLVPHQVSKPVKVHHARRYIKQISTLPGQMVVHIETTGDDNSILAGEGYISVC
jgi:hypothetical protein